MGVGIDGVGPRRESRGPKIMDSRKRRMGSVLTGSGSDSEDETSRMDGLEKVENQEEEKRANCQDDGKIGTPEPVDNTPVSLLTLAILARKIQCTTSLINLTNYSTRTRTINAQLPPP